MSHDVFDQPTALDCAEARPLQRVDVRVEPAPDRLRYFAKDGPLVRLIALKITTPSPQVAQSRVPLRWVAVVMTAVVAAVGAYVKQPWF